MTLAEILEELPNLTPAERLTLIEAALELLRKELPQEQQPAMSAEQQSALARKRLLDSLDEREEGLLQKIFRVFTG